MLVKKSSYPLDNPSVKMGSISHLLTAMEAEGMWEKGERHPHSREPKKSCMELKKSCSLKEMDAKQTESPTNF